ncbi:UNVERIFIED_CONTAM: hypothetical protein FKN15_061212, partial [Acipenser sinensis]
LFVCCFCQVENVRLLDRVSSRKAPVGTLYLNATHVIFVENAPETRKETWILHSQICAVEKRLTSATGCPLLIRCKNYQVIEFIILQERDCQDVYISLMRLSRPEKYEELYCFSFNPNLDKEDREQAWNFIDLKAEYNRMGVPNQLWHITHVNRDYGVCDTYPTVLYVPTSATSPIIMGSSKFRSRGRFPTLSYYSHDNHASICRSSQPLSGFSARCLEDEQMLKAITKANPGSQFMYVVDTRPKLNAMANKAAGKGYENEDNYSNIKFQFIGIENIHVMRNSLQKMLEVCDLKSLSMGDFLWGLENSGWLKHIRAILDAGIFIAKAVAEEAVSVLVHCSDGWDRTAQVCSVASLLLDPYYRTLKGFMVSVFKYKYSHLDGDPKEVSPVIDQFIECVWHLMEQFPCAFEYNERFLVHVHNHIYSCQYGNFICNSQKERCEQRFWRGMYNRFEKGLHPRQSAIDFLMAVKEETQQLEEDLEIHEEKIAKLEKLQVKNNTIKAKPRNINKRLGVSTSDNSIANTPQDYTGTAGTFPSRSPSQLDESSVLILTRDTLKSSDPDLATNSDQESGVADLSCHSPSGEDSADAVNSAA